MRKTLYLSPVLGLALVALPSPGWSQQTPAAPQTAPQRFIPVSAGVAQKYRMGGDIPIYPAIAKAARVQGTVVLQVTISRTGAVEYAHIISGPPMLQQAALDAVRTWTYQPYLLNGEPVGMKTTVNVVFTLGSTPTSTEAAGSAGPSQQGDQNPDVRTVQVQVAPPLEPSDTPAPAHPITTEQVHELMQMTGAVNLTKQMLDAMMPTLRQTMPPYVPADVLDDFEKTLLGADFEAMLVRTYQAHLSTEDAAQIIAFYQTPAGQHMLAAMPQIAKESQAAGQQLGEQVMIEVLQRHQSEIEAAKEKYESQHPWSAPNN